MIYKLDNMAYKNGGVTAFIDGERVLARPENWKYRTYIQRLKEAWAVFSGKADAFTWPKGQ